MREFKATLGYTVRPSLSLKYSGEDFTPANPGNRKSSAGLRDTGWLSRGGVWSRGGRGNWSYIEAEISCGREEEVPIPDSWVCTPLSPAVAEPWAGSLRARKDDGRGHLGLGLGGPRDWGGARAGAAQPRGGIRACGAHSSAAGAYCHSREHEGPNPGAPHGESDPRAPLTLRPAIFHSALAGHGAPTRERREPCKLGRPPNPHGSPTPPIHFGSRTRAFQHLY